MKAVKVRIANKSNNELPKYVKPGDSGMDIRASLSEPITLKSLERKLIPTGIFVELPEGYEFQVRPRSGLAIKRGLTVLNTPGTVDANYRGEICVIMINLSEEDQTIDPGERIAQLVLASVEKAELELVPEVSKDTERGDTGFGESGRF